MASPETVREATQGQVRELCATLAQLLPEVGFEGAKHLIGRKGVWGPKVQSVLLEEIGLACGELGTVTRDWERFYLNIFGETKSFSKLVIPARQSGFDRLIIVAAGTMSNRLFAKCKEKFGAWRWTEDLDTVVSDRKADKDYAIWIRDRVEADQELKNLSANILRERCVVGITLEERLIYELKYFSETAKHLDINNITLCSGSLYSGGGVPGVYWGVDDGLSVGWYDPDDARDYLRSRAVVS